MLCIRTPARRDSNAKQNQYVQYQTKSQPHKQLRSGATPSMASDARARQVKEDQDDEEERCVCRKRRQQCARPQHSTV